MKVRLGFVSNSSSSSFCIYGAAIDVGDLAQTLRKDDLFGLDFSEVDMEDCYEVLQAIEMQSPIFYAVYDSENGTAYIGANPTNMKDDETMGQFKEKVKKEFNRIFSEDISLTFITETVYN